MKKLFLALAFVIGSVGFAQAMTLTNDLTWASVPEAQAYVVQQDTDGAGFVEIAQVTTLTYQDAGLAMGPTYSWRILSKRLPSGIVSAPSPTCSTDTSLPAAPSSLSCSSTFVP